MGVWRLLVKLSEHFFLAPLYCPRMAPFRTTFIVRFGDVDSAGIVYYLRAELVGETVGRVARAWSSPIWIEPAD